MTGKDYRPSDEDIIKLRIKTTGINQTTVTVEGINYSVFDVGGQKSERKKWFNSKSLEIHS